MVLDELKDGAEFEFGVPEETEEDFCGAIACASPHAEHGGVGAVGAEDDGLDGIGEGELQVIVCVDADLFAGSLEGGCIFLDQVIDLFSVEVPEAIDDDDGGGGRCGGDFEGLIDFVIADDGDGHDIEVGLVTESVAMFEHVHGFRDLVYVAGDADHVQDALGSGDDLVFPIGLTAGVCHGGEFEAGIGGGVIADDAAHDLFLAMSPGAVAAGGELLRGIFVTDFHVVDACGDASVVDGTDDLVAEVGIIDEAAVSDGAIEDGQFGAICDPGGFIRHGAPWPD